MENYKILNWGGASRSDHRRAFTLVELLVVIAIIGVLIALLLPAVQAAREAARRMQCTNNLKQAGIAVHNFENTHLRVPAWGGDAMWLSYGNNTGLRQYSHWTLLLPYVEQQSVYDIIVERAAANAPIDPGDYMFNGAPSPFAHGIAAFLCPSDPFGRPGIQDAPVTGACNYRASVGDLAVFETNWSEWNRPRGVFRPYTHINDSDRSVMHGETTFSYISDGLSNTVLFSEAGISSNRSEADRDSTIRGGIAVNLPTAMSETPPDQCAAFRGVGGELNTTDLYGNYLTYLNSKGQRWGDARPKEGGGIVVCTVLPPNSPTCRGNQNSFVVSASSYHPGGANAALSDGAVRFVSETIDCDAIDEVLGGGAGFERDASGQGRNCQTYSGPSTFGVWGALGSAAGGDQAALP